METSVLIQPIQQCKLSVRSFQENAWRGSMNCAWNTYVFVNQSCTACSLHWWWLGVGFVHSVWLWTLRAVHKISGNMTDGWEWAWNSVPRDESTHTGCLPQQCQSKISSACALASNKRATIKQRRISIYIHVQCDAVRQPILMHIAWLEDNSQFCRPRPLAEKLGLGEGLCQPCLISEQCNVNLQTSYLLTWFYGVKHVQCSAHVSMLQKLSLLWFSSHDVCPIKLSFAPHLSTLDCIAATLLWLWLQQLLASIYQPAFWKGLASDVADFTRLSCLLNDISNNNHIHIVMLK